MRELAKADLSSGAILERDTPSYPGRPWVGVGVVVWRDDEFLLIRRGKPPRMGEWAIPGGRQELGETVRQTAIREIKEETGVDIELVGLVDVYDAIRADNEGRIASHFTLIDFAARWVAGDAVAGDDAMGVGWFKIAELSKLNLWKETVNVIQSSLPLMAGQR